MLFNSLSFIFVFLPLCLLLYYAAVRVSLRLAEGVLVAFSLLFYGWWNKFFLVLLLGSIAFNYVFGLILLHNKDKPKRQNVFLWVSVVSNILLLFYFKYLYSLMAWFDAIGFHIPRESNSVILPLGISFFTFTQIGYLVDCKAGLTKGGKLLDYMLFVTFFPHLIAGPILHHREMIPQFAAPETYRFKLSNFCVGLTLFIMGLFKKILVADTFAPLANNTFEHAGGLSLFTAWGGTLSYTAQLYFDFSGYSEMAVGLALLFGLRFPANFNSPYKAQSIIDYWQRWNMTLTRYLTLYVYNPLALWNTRRLMGKGQILTSRTATTFSGFTNMIAFPMLVTMILAGIWHGAGSQFLVFGLLHATYLIVNHAWRTWGPKKSKDNPRIIGAIHVVGKVGLTMLAVVLAQIFFRATSLHNAFDLLQSLAGQHPFSEEGVRIMPGFVETIMLDNQLHFIEPWLLRLEFGSPLTLLLCFAWIFAMPNALQLTAAYKPTLSNISVGPWKRVAWRPNIVWAFILAVMASLAILAVTGTTEFIYFQF